MRHRIIQYILIIIVLAGIAGGYFYFSSSAAQKINASKVNNLTSGLVGYWTFDGADINIASPYTVTDRSVNGYSGTLSTTGSTRPSQNIGKIGQGLLFDGSTSYINMGNVLDMTTNDFSISAWIKTNNDGRIVSKRDDNDTVKGYSFRVSGGVLAIQIYGSGVALSSCGQIAVNNGMWHHVVAVFDRDAIGACYVDNAYDPGSVSIAGQNGNNLSVSKNFVIGTRSDVDGQFLNGSLDEVRVYNRALSPSEITELYQQGQTKINASQANKLTSGLVSYWTMDGADTNWTSSTAGTVTDKSPGGSNTGTIANMSQSTSPVAGKIGQAMLFNEVNDVISRSNATGLPSGNNPFTLSVWVNPSSVSGLKFVAGWGPTSSYKANWLFLSGGKMFHINYSNSGDAAANTAIGTNTWSHLVVTYDGGTPGTRKYYLNGSPDGSNTPQTMNVTGTNLTLSYDLNENSMNFVGKIDEFRVYNRALSQSEITELYQQGQAKINASQTGKLTNGLVGYWPLDGNYVDWSQSSAEIRDASGNGNHGDAINSGDSSINSSSVRIGKIGQGLYFDNFRDYVSAGDINALDSSSYLTTSAWVKINVFRPYGSAVIKKSDINNGFNMYLDNDTHLGAVAVEVSNGGFVYAMTDSLNVTNELGIWHHWTMVFDGTQISNANRLKFYFDGTQKTIDFVSGTVPATTSNNSASFIIGNNGNPSPDATLDEVRIYNRALSQSEVTELYNLGR